MSRTADYEAKTEALLGPIAAENNVTVYDVEYIKEGSDYILRAYIDKEGGVSINDCEAVSRALSTALDENDFIAGAYVLEVSSPGLGRRLKKDKHLLKSIGAEVELKTYQPAGKSKKPKGNKGRKEFTGILTAFDDEKIIIALDGAETAFDRADIAVIKLKFDF
jgi:ribosome maturation factor RimP